MIIGLSGAPMEPSLFKNFDGIGVYTKLIYEILLSEQKIDVIPIVLGKNDSELIYSRNVKDDFIRSILMGFIGKRYLLPCDLMHFTDYKIIPSKQPSIATIHDAVPLSHPEWVSDRYRHLKNMILKKVVKYADHYIAISNHAKTELMEYFNLSAEKIHIVNNSIDDRWFFEMDLNSQFLKKQNIEEDYFLFVGTFQPRKNIENLIRAYWELPKEIKQRHQLILVGRSGWKNEEILRLLSLSQEYFPSRVIWFDNISSFYDLRQFYLHANSLVFPSLHEGFGIPILEAFASSIPVIASNRGAIPEVAGNAALYFNPYDFYEIAEKMQYLSKISSTDRLILVNKGHHQLQNFKKDKIREQLLNAYHVALSGV